MSTLTITEFLEARIDEDEAHASSGWSRLGDSRWETTNDGQDFLTPSAVLAECAAKRAIVELADQVETMDYQITNEWGGGLEGTGDNILKALAAVYKDHSDYQEDWAL